MSRPADRCPGVFSAHPAADGYLARIRLPGGRIEPPQLEALAGVAVRFGDGHLELTSRGNLQVRGITDVAEIAAAAKVVMAAGLIPTPSHERVRNLQLSALSGRCGGRADLRPVLAELDAGLRADPVLADLPARFLFGLDDGRGDILAQQPDAGLVAHSPDDLELVLGGAPTGRRAVGATTVLAAARAFLDDRGDEWRIADLSARPGLDALLAELIPTSYPIPEPPTEPLVGWLPQDDGLVTLGAVVEHARLPARTAEYLAAIGTDLYITPNREILVCDLSEDVADTVLRVLAPLGLIFDAASPWVRVSSCVGSPGCARSHADVRGDLEARVRDGQVEREHWCGCERHCGKPHGAVTVVVATPTGYRVER